MADLDSIDLNLLRTLEALLVERSVSRAAQRLGLSAPTLNHALARLRKELDDPVLVRAGRTMDPSTRALELEPRVRALMDEVRDVFRPRARFDPLSSDREFTMHGSDYLIMVIGSALDELCRGEGATVSLRFMPNTVQDPALVRDGSIDLAIGVYTKLHPEIRIKTLFDEDLVCVVRDDHPDVGKRISLAAFSKLEHVQIAPRGRLGGIVDDALEARGRRRRVARSVPFFVSALEMVTGTDFVLTLPRRLATSHAGVFGLRMLELPLELPSYAMSMIWHPRHDGDAGHAWLRERLVEAAERAAPRRRTSRGRARSGTPRT